MPAIVSKAKFLKMAGSKIADVFEKSPGRFQVTGEATVEIEDREKPALVAETLIVYVSG